MLGWVGRGVSEVWCDGSARQDGTTPLWAACEEGHVEVVNRLMEAGADVNQADKVSAMCVWGGTDGAGGGVGSGGGAWWGSEIGRAHV